MSRVRVSSPAPWPLTGSAIEAAGGPPSTGSAESGLAGARRREPANDRDSAISSWWASDGQLGRSEAHGPFGSGGAGTLPVVPAAWMDLCRMPVMARPGGAKGRAKAGAERATLRVAPTRVLERAAPRVERAQGLERAAPRVEPSVARTQGPESPSGPPAEIGAKGCWLLTRSENRRAALQRPRRSAVTPMGCRGHRAGLGSASSAPGAALLVRWPPRTGPPCSVGRARCGWGR